MDSRGVERLERLRAEFAEVTGAPFQHFACPLLFRDEVAPLCRAHIVNRASPDSARRWTIQRKDVDNFFGSVFEADFVNLQHNTPGIAARALLDPGLRRALRPKITFRGEEVPYFVPGDSFPKGFTRITFGDSDEQVRLALKVASEEVANSSDGDWDITVGRDLTVQAVVSVVKAAHLTLFELFGYRYALSRAGVYVGSTLGSFFEENRDRNKRDVLSRAVSHFSPFATLVRPVGSKETGLIGTIDDGYAEMCWLEESDPQRPWGMIVFVRTGELLNAALMPMFDDRAGVERFSQLLERGADRFVTTTVRFRDDHWEATPHRKEVLWPAATLDREPWCDPR